jgi:hypothetical protein
MNAHLQERRPRRDGVLQTTFPRPGGGAPKLAVWLTAVPKACISIQT